MELQGLVRKYVGAKQEKHTDGHEHQPGQLRRLIEHGAYDAQPDTGAQQQAEKPHHNQAEGCLRKPSPDHGHIRAGQEDSGYKPEQQTGIGGGEISAGDQMIGEKEGQYRRDAVIGIILALVQQVIPGVRGAAIGTLLRAIRVFKGQQLR